MGKGQLIEFSYKVRGDFSPKGLQKVFFSFHPEDISQMMLIVDDVLEMVNCEIYYHIGKISQEEIDLDDYSLKLGEMKLFVVIVTTNYLMNDSFSKNWEYGYAVKQHIPILPVAVEPGLESFFTTEMNQIGKGYGDIQLLKSQVNDDTEIDYRQKLCRDLKAILVNDNEIEKIRKAFSGQIFLSYRKKDRKYANELMKTIHGIPSLQRVSIWYDEFISTGENWSDQIGTALKNSDIFLLMVTASIMEPDNYVIREEYPAAIEQNKKIVSVRKSSDGSVALDREKLRELFPGVKAYIDGDNVNELEEALRELEDRQSSSVEKNYLIGLAFFNGIGVEKDSEKAVSLIMAAAQKNFPAAISKLADMYWKGDGLAVNYENSILWRKRLVAFYSSRLKDIKDTWEMENYVRTLISLSSSLYELSSFRDSLKYGKVLVELLKQATSFSESESFDKYLTQAYNLCSKSSKRLGLCDEALIYAKKDCLVSLAHYQSNECVVNYHNLAVAYQRIGDIYYVSGDLEQTKSWYLKAIEIDEDINERLKSIDSALSLSTSILRLGDIYVRYGKYDEADHLYKRAVLLKRRILDAEDTDKYQRGYADAILSRGNSQILSGDIKTAKVLFEEAKNIYAELAEKSGMIELQYACSVALNRCAKICEKEGDFQKALEYYAQSLERRKKILSHIRTGEAVYEFAVTRYFMAGVYGHLYDNVSAKAEYEEVINLLLPILVKDQRGNMHRVQAEAAFERFKIDTFLGKRYLRYAIDAWEWLIDREPDNKKYQEQYDCCRRVYRRCYPE